MFGYDEDDDDYMGGAIKHTMGAFALLECRMVSAFFSDCIFVHPSPGCVKTAVVE